MSLCVSASLSAVMGYTHVRFEGGDHVLGVIWAISLCPLGAIYALLSLSVPVPLGVSVSVPWSLSVLGPLLMGPRAAAPLCQQRRGTHDNYTKVTSATPRGRTPVTPYSPPHTHSGSRPMRVDTQTYTQAGCTPVCARSLRHAGAPHAVTFTSGQSHGQSASQPRSEPHVLTHVIGSSLVRRAHPSPRQPCPWQGCMFSHVGDCR